MNKNEDWCGILVIVYLIFIFFGGTINNSLKKERELKLKNEYIGKIKKLYKLENNSRGDLIIEELEEKDIDFIKDYYFTILFKEEKK